MSTRYSIILVHGIVLKDIKFFKAFGRIEKKLKDSGYVVYTAKTDGFGTIENNALQLKEYVEKVLATEHAEKVNLIAHSKGGLDALCMINNLGMEDKVASLTTLCTPHYGSPIASSLLRLPKFIVKFLAFWINFWYRIFGDKHPDALEVCKQLQNDPNTERERQPIPATVYCQSFSTTLKRSRDDFVMGIPLAFCRRLDGTPGDGLVTAPSTEFGNYRGDCTDDSLSHSQIVDFMAGKKKKEKIYAFYTGLCEELAEMGF